MNVREVEMKTNICPDSVYELCSFGVIADVQYADCDNRMNFEKTATRFYRQSLNAVKSAVSDWKSNKVSFIINLGDTIDGVNKKNETSEEALAAVLNLLAESHVPVFHVWGNHEFYNFSREWLLKSPIMNPSMISEYAFTKLPGSTAYSHFSPTIGFRIILMDQYEISMLGQDLNSQSFLKAKEMLNCNKNKDLNSPVGLIGKNARFVQFNGGVSEDQLHWLESILEMSQINKETVIIAGHHPLETIDYLYVCLCWNYDAILTIVHKYSCVLAYLSGHCHQFCYLRDLKGIHHITLPGVIETNPDVGVAHGTLKLYNDRVELHGNGALPTIVMPKKQF